MGLAASSDQLSRRGCVECPSTQPTCPVCPAGKTCTLVAQSCSSCAQTICVGSVTSAHDTVAAPPPKKSSSGGASIGAGVVGGLAVIVGIILVWWFLRRKRRNAAAAAAAAGLTESDAWVEKRNSTRHQQQQPQLQMTSARHHSSYLAPSDFAVNRASVASNMTSLTDASGMHVTIGFLPDVTANPVPPIPVERRANGQDIIFSLNDLNNRNTLDTFTGTPSITPSLDGRSIASGSIRDDAIANPMPLTPAYATATRAKPHMISLKHVSKGPTAETGTAMPVVLASSSKSDPPGGASAVAVSTLGYAKPTLTTVKRNPSNSKGRYPVRSDSSSSKPGSSSLTGSGSGSGSGSPVAVVDESPLSMSAVATTPWSTDLTKENERIAKSKFAVSPPNPFTDDHAA